MTNKKRLRKNLKRFSNSTEQPLKFYSGALGIFIGGRQYVDVPNRPGFVYVRLRNNISELIQAHNQLVSPVYDLPVLVVRGNNYYEIYSRDTQQYTSYWETQSSFLPRHGFQHEFDPANNGGGDLVFVHGEQFYPLMGFPSGTDGAGNILIAPYRYYANSAWHYAGDTGTSNLLTHRPTGSANAKLLLIGLTVDTGNPFIKVGNEFSESITGAAALTQYVPTSIDVTEEIPGTIVRLVTGTQSITWANIYDARQYMGILQAAAVTGSFGGSFLQLNDTPDSYVGQTEKIVAVNNAGTGLEFRTNTGSSGASNFLALTDTPDSYSGQANKFVAVNAGATGLEFVNSPAGTGGSGVVVLDDSVYKVTGTAISFDRNLSVSVTGTTAFVSTNDKELDYVQITGTVSVTATTEGTADTVITGNSINVDGSTRIMVEFHCGRIQPSPAAANRYIVLTLFDSATVLGQLALLRTPATGNDDKAVLARRFLTPSAGSHQYIVKAWVSAGTGSIFAEGGGTVAGMPAYLRVVEAQAFS